MELEIDFANNLSIRNIPAPSEKISKVEDQNRFKFIKILRKCLKSQSSNRQY